jgi:outer membrane receptor protein involved in Fe transport
VNFKLFRTGAVGALMLALTAAPCWAQAVPPATIDFDIPAEPLGKALQAFAAQTHQQLLFASDSVSGRNAPAIKGRFAPDAVLKRLLTGSGLQVQRAGPTSLVLKPSTPDTVPHRTASTAVQTARPLSAPPEGLAQAAAVTAPGDLAVPETVQEVTVTGSHIRGVQPSSPVVSLTANAILESGQTDLGEAIRSLPQDFGGGQNPGIGLVAGGSANQNATSGSSVNLRGLGQDATLTLLNGRRLSAGGFTPSVDIGAIPIAAVDKVQIVLDGASAIYGSDAVAGVANVILKRDFDGVTASARLGGTSDGGDTQRQYSLVGGDRWSSGGFIAAINYEDDDGISSQERSFTSIMPKGTSLYPEISTLNGLISLHQDLTSFAHFSIDALYSHHWSQESFAEPPYVNIHETVGEVTTAVSPTLSFDLPHHWQLALNGTISSDQDRIDEVVAPVSAGPSSSVNLCYCNREKSAEIDANGPLVTLPAGPIQVALGAGYRSNYFDARIYGTSSYVGGGRSSGFTFGELAVPLVAPDQQIPGVHKLDLNAALRFEDYSDAGQVTTPKVGLVWSPISDVDLKASWGQSFQAPILYDEFETHYVAVYPAAVLGGQGYPASASAILNEGGNATLKPERATTITAGVVYHPARLSGLRIELGYFHIDYTNRVVQPITVLNAGTLANPENAPFITYSPTASAQAALINSPGVVFANETGAPYSANNVVAIVNDGYTNAAREEYQGVDMSATYRMATLGGMLDLIGSSSWLQGNEQIGADAPAVDTVGTVFNPPHWRDRAGLVWRRDGFDVATYLNYIGGVRDIRRTPNINGASETTTDLAFGYKLGVQAGLLNDSQIRFSIINLFDKDPPRLIPSVVYAQPYDSTNYSAIGRLMSLTVSKHF